MLEQADGLFARSVCFTVKLVVVLSPAGAPTICQVPLAATVTVVTAAPEHAACV